MPPPRRHSPGRRDRRSRSRSRSHSPRSSYKKRRSPSPRSRGRSKSPRRSRSRERKRSKSPYNKRKNSRTPERRKSTGSKRKSSSPHDYDLPIKRQADSTRRSYRSRSRSQSPGPSKKSKSSRRSPSPYDGKLYSDERSHSSSKKLRKQEIDMVKIVDQGKKMDKLDKRFQTLEQLAQGSFDPEENITIGIHRGPHHVDLDEDVECKYDFNPKLFVMLYPKKDYSAPIFDRDEIKMFNHDSILDEEAYVEKRTITVKPTDKPKASSSKYRDMDYKITVGAGRDKYGDKRMVLDTSRSSRHDPEVKIRLDAKPDPKYERLYKAQQRYEERGVHDDDIKRNPSDLRYNLMRRRSSERERDRDSERGRREDNSMMDARSRIEAKRKGLDKGSHGERGVRDLSPPETRIEKRKVGIRTELPDFKNRPDKFQYDNWEVNPAVTPKGSSYYEHDNRSREDMTFWERKQMYLKTGRTPPSRGLIRGRGRGRIVSQGISRGITRPFNNSRPFNSQPLQSRPPNRPRTAAMDEWKHDKFSEVETDDNITEPKRVGDVESRVTKSTNKDRSTKERSEKDSKEKLSDARYRIDRKGNKGEERKDGKGGNNQTVKVKRENLDIIKEEAALNMDSNISVTME